MPPLATIRAAHVERVQAAYERDQARRRPIHTAGLPNSLISAGCWLVHNGWDGEPCEAERLTNWLPRRYRLYLATLDPEAFAHEIEDGRRALFEGWHPVVAAPVLAKAA